MPIHAPSIRRPITCTCLAFLTALGGSITRAEEVSTPIVLARDGATEYVILLPEDPSPPQVFAATELQRFLLRMSGAFFPIRHHGDDRTAPAITLHDTGADSALGREGFFLRADGDGVHVGGSAGRGIVYGSFALLERLGCRWYAPDCEVIPNAPELRLARLDVTETPDFDYREPWYMMSWDEDWAVRNRINGMGPTLDAVRGGRFGYLSSYFCHTFDLILPADRFLETHPQWYSLVDGRRVGGQYKGQLCLTNEAMIEAFIDATRGVLDAHPETRILSVSQNDNQNYCQCDACRRIDAEEASPAGLMVRFANRIAADLHADYPEVLYHTFAYQYTEKPPRVTKPHPNVVIMLCSIECCQYHRYDRCPHNTAFVNHLRRWRELTDQLHIWHYNTNFRHYLVPFPDLRQLPHSLKLYQAHDVKGLIAQGMEPGGRGFMDELKAYLVARLLWDASLDPQVLRAAFLHAYFGEAAAPINHLLRLLHDRVETADVHGTCFEDQGFTGRRRRFYPAGDGPLFLTEDVVAECRRRLSEARAATRDPVVLGRLERVAFSFDYFDTMERARLARDGDAESRAQAWRDVQALAERSRRLGFEEWTMGRGSIDRRLKKMEAVLTTP